MPSAIKFVLNIFFFFIYLIVSVIFWNFLYWLVLDQVLNKTVPWPSDPIHMKIALVVLVIVAIFTLVFRKYFYISLKKKENKMSEVNEKVEVKEFAFDEMAKNISFIEEELKPEIKVEKNEKLKKEVKREDWDIEIFMGKEIK